jgi:very-short-patch-repair endonuclease
MFTKVPSLDNNFILAAGSKESHQYMKLRKSQHLNKFVSAEEWATLHIKVSGERYSRQAIWQSRLFDFWFSVKGIAIEIDGESHNSFKQSFKDSVTDKHFYELSGIIVVRVKNYNINELNNAISFVKNSCSWKERRKQMGIENSKQRRKQLSISLKSKCLT